METGVVPRIVVVGPLVQDITAGTRRLPAAGESATADEVLIAAGGKGGNPALTLARMGASVRMVGAVGDDEAGRDLLLALVANGVETTGVRIGGRTGRVVHLVEGGATDRYLQSDGPTASAEVDDADLRGDGTGADAVLVSTAFPESPVRAAARYGRAEGALVVVDGAGSAETTRSVLADADVIRLDANEASVLLERDVDSADDAGEAAASLLGDPFPRVAVVQAGEHGDVVVSAGGRLHLPRLPVQAVDPTGAGDAFVAVLTLLLACETPIAAAARLATAAAAHTAGRLGARTTFTGVDELLALLAESG